ncbi:MAG: Fe-S protein radical family [Candidatus Angelobacter sp.]|jgi:MoaA/NifB/PqqE/SkfB family radical SAM enzyme|nr:Fe-S protein radical family [Candidatus Angelobacter sp.]
MKSSEVLRAWGSILRGRSPSLSIEITRECPLRCPGCYAYEDQHLGGNGVSLRSLSDFKGDDLVRRVLELVDRSKPLHLSIVGGDPLVRFREMNLLLPEIAKRDIHVQVVTSAFRQIPAEWASIKKLNICVSVDGLQPEHDDRRKPATYERILKNISGHQVTIHCTITGQMLRRSGYLAEFLQFWSARPEVKRIWFSLFTPQRGAIAEEILTPTERQSAVEDLVRLRALHPKLDMDEGHIRNFLRPPSSPKSCIFAQTTTTISADLKTRVEPCQFGGDPDCSQCGCVASAGLARVGDLRVMPGITAGDLFQISNRIGKAIARNKTQEPAEPPRPQLTVLQS